MDAGKILKFSMDAGEVMLKNGGETNRVEDTMLRILKKFSFKDVEVFVTPTGIFASIVEESGQIHTLVKRILTRTTNLEKIALVNSLSRKLVEGKADLSEACHELNEIRAKKPYPHIYKCIAASLSCASFAYMFGGSMADSAAALITGFILYNTSAKLSSGKLSSSIATVINGMTVAVIILALYHLGVGENTDKGIIGSLMLLVPGVGFTNAVRDVMIGDYISGTSRIVDALIVAVCIATGVGAGLSLYTLIGGGFSI